jgi:hypothetical protein
MYHGDDSACGRYEIDHDHEIMRRFSSETETNQQSRAVVCEKDENSIDLIS